VGEPSKMSARVAGSCSAMKKSHKRRLRDESHARRALDPTIMTTPIPPNPPRWEPSEDPSSIVVPGLDTTASVNDQIDQIEQLITIKLQVCVTLSVDTDHRQTNLLRTSMLTSPKYKISCQTGFCLLSNGMQSAPNL
jgi:hypothetical protein